MTILILRSSFQSDAFVRQEYGIFIETMRRQLNAGTIILGEEESADKMDAMPQPDAVMTATGGVENLFVRVMPRLKSDIVLIADGRNNSLAAALEILSYLHAHGRKGRIIHGTDEEMIQALKQGGTFTEEAATPPLSCHIHDKLLQGTRIGCFGAPSDWLISSNIDKDAVKERYGIEMIPIDLNRIGERMELPEQQQSATMARTMLEKAKTVVEPTSHDMMQAAKAYHAIKAICEEENLAAMTIRCFDLVNKYKTTSCMALGLLNDEGIVAGCEGDQQTLVTMLLAEKLCGEKAFMANPSLLRKEYSLLAHCTIPTTMCDSITLRSHFESSIGVAIEGHLPETEYTIMKWGGDKLDRYFVAEAEALPCDSSSHFCRTQIMLGADLRGYMLNHSIGNHHVIIRGRHAAAIRQFMSDNGVTEIR